MSDVSIHEILWMYYYIVLIATAAIAVYGIVRRPNLLKKIIMLSILSDTGNTLAILLGYRFKAKMPPVYPGITFEWSSGVERLKTFTLKDFAAAAVDPIPQVLVVTAIVIGMAVMLFLAFAAMLVYRHYGTLDVREISKRVS